MTEPPRTTKQLTLDDLYYMVSYIYGEKNFERSLSVTFMHFVEICGMLSSHDQRKKREDLNFEDILCKALGWFFPLVAKFRVLSIEELIYRKYPYVCPYCRKCPHDESICKRLKGTKSTVDHNQLMKLYETNKVHQPKGLNEWQHMFSAIYPRSLNDVGRSTIALLEEVGELAEAIRVFDKHPKYFAGECSDVFSYIMGIANEYSLRSQSNDNLPLNYESEFLKHYPGLCTQCGYQICNCPNIPESTVGRMAKELDLRPADNLFSLNHSNWENRAVIVRTEVLESIGGYTTISKQFPLDRGDTNRAIVLLCLRISELIKENHPDMAKLLNDAAIQIGSDIKSPGSKDHSDSIENVIDLLTQVWSHQSLKVLSGDNTIVGTIGRHLQVQSCKFGIVTALPIEFTAVKIMLEECFPYVVGGDPNDYIIGTIPVSESKGSHLVVVTLLKDIGNNSAAAAAANLLRSFPNIEDILMVGIAGGIPAPESPEKHVRLGDIVISNKEGVVQYDNLKVDVEKIEIRSSAGKPSAKLIGRVKMLEAEHLEGKYPWEKYILRGKEIENGERPDDSRDELYSWVNGDPVKIDHPDDLHRRKGQPKIYFGRIGASNTLLKDPHLRDKLGRDCNVLAIEMEGSGIADGAWNAGKHYLLIRGVCDYCDPQKNDIWHRYAAVVAAAYCRALLESVPMK